MLGSASLHILASYYQPLNGALAHYRTKDMSYTINGEEPNIIGSECEGFILSQIQEDFQITDPANVVYLKFNGTWYRLYFDGNTVFWRSDENVAFEPVNGNFDCCTTILNLNEMDGIVGSKLESIVYSSTESEVIAALAFSQGKTLELTHYGNQDVTQIKC